MHSNDEMVYLRDVVETLIYMTDEDSDGVEEVMQLPTIDIVRCKECKCAEDCEQMVVFENGKYYKLDFCSYGEREGE